MNKISFVDTGSAKMAPVLFCPTADDHLDKNQAIDLPNIMYPSPPLDIAGTSELRFLYVDGCAAYRGDPIESPSDLKKIAQVRRQFVQNWSTQIHGVAAAYLEDRVSGDILLLPDPLGGALVYIYTCSTHSLISTSLRSLTRVAEYLGERLTPSPSFFTELLAADAGGFGGTSFEEIQVLPIFHYIEVKRSGNVNIRSFDLEPSLFGVQRTFEESLDATAADLIENARAASRFSGHKTAHLSAGADSRLVAAALSKAEVGGNFHYFCASNPVSNESRIASAVARHLSLTMTHHPGMCRAYRFEDSMVENLATLDMNRGMKASGSPHAGYVRSCGVVLAGTYGENFRSFYSIRFEGRALEPTQVVNNLWGELLANRETGLIRTDVLNLLEEKISSIINQAKSFEVREDAIGDYFYLVGRNRYFTGVAAMEASRYSNYFVPLYSIEGTALALQLPLIDRSEGRIIRDLFSRLDSRFLEIPFDKPKFGPSVLAKHPIPVIADVSDMPEPVFDDFNLGVPEVVRGTYYHGFRIGRNHVEKAKRISGVKAYQVASEVYARQRIRQILRDSPEFFEQVFKLDRLRALISRPARTMMEIRVVNRIAEYGTWYSELC